MSGYNLDNLRILWEFALDGIIFNPYIDSTIQYTGDYGVVNAKNDIVEAIYRTNNIKTMQIQIDAGKQDTQFARTKAITIDTFALLNTNLSLDAKICLYGYGDATTITPTYDQIKNQGTCLINTTKKQLCNNDEYQKDCIWCSPTEEIRKFRHWALYIEDLTNTSNYLEIGRLLGGQASILIYDEKDGSTSFLDNIDFEEVSYIDRLDLNGFTSIANERAMKKKLFLSFENMSQSSQNYKILQRYWRYVRDTKKALIIPTPKVPTAFHVFSKLSEMPKQKIKYVEDIHIYVNFDLSYDEAK